MATIGGALLDFKRLDELATRDTPMHRLDPRVKVLVTLLYIVSVVSFGRYELSALVPFLFFPVVLVTLGDVPVTFLLKKVALLCTFAIVVGLFNPIFDRATFVTFGHYSIAGGWVSWASIILRAALTITAALTLVAITGFPAICRGLELLGMPKAFAVQLVFLYRYIMVLTEEGERASRARELRSFGKKGQGMASYSSLVGNLLLRTLQRGERVHMAMLARGFSGSLRSCDEPSLEGKDYLFLFSWSAFFIVFRFYNGSKILGSIITGY